MVSAWATTNRLVLAQRQVDQRSNEITAIPELIKVLDISSCEMPEIYCENNHPKPRQAYYYAEKESNQCVEKFISGSNCYKFSGFSPK